MEKKIITWSEDLAMGGVLLFLFWLVFRGVIRNSTFEVVTFKLRLVSPSKM